MKLPDAVFLDRDGTIMEDAHYIKSPDQVRLIPGAAAAVKRINDAGVRAIVVTNQSGLARGKFKPEDYEAVRKHFEALLAAEGAHIDASYFCPHHPSITGPCNCRKPATENVRGRDPGFPARRRQRCLRWRPLARCRRVEEARRPRNHDRIAHDHG